MKELDKYRKMVEIALRRYLPAPNVWPKSLHTAMRYSVLAGGKRLRPILVLLAAEVCGGEKKKVLALAAAIEYIHTYTLIHDDLPAMDNDDYRRGKPTCHKKFNEAIAILAGDALLTQAYRVIAREMKIPAERKIAIISFISEAISSQHLIGGQVLDTMLSGKFSRQKDRKKLEQIHYNKTAALLVAALVSGALAVGASKAKIKALSEYGKNIGLAFQIVDDVLDIIGDKRKLGKSGSDRQNQKLTYPVIFGIRRSQEIAREKIAAAKKAIKIFGQKGEIFNRIADFIVQRQY